MPSHPAAAVFHTHQPAHDDRYGRVAPLAVTMQAQQRKALHEELFVEDLAQQGKHPASIKYP